MTFHALLIIPLYITSIATLWLLVYLTIKDRKHSDKKPEQGDPAAKSKPATSNGKTVYLTADHERRISEKMSQDSETPHEDIW